MARRAYGTGSVYQRARDGKWVASLETGWTARGTRRRKTRVRASQTDARTALRDMMREAEQDGAPTIGGKPTVKTWAETWLETTSHRLRPTTWKANRSQVTAWIIPTIGHRRLEQLRPAHVRSVARAMERAGLAPSTVARGTAVLDWLLKDAVREGLPVPRAALLVEHAGPGETDRDAIPLPDALAILEAASRRPDSSRWAAAFLQGMRPGECLGLTWDHVDFENDVIDVSRQLKPLPYKLAHDQSSGFRVPAHYGAVQVRGALHLVAPKTDSGRRIIPLVPWMRASLLAWRERCPATKHGLVWPDEEGHPRVSRDDRQQWRDITDEAQVARVDGAIGRRYALYEARHTCATLLRQLGASDATITALVGHASILSTRAYLHTDRASERRALEQAAARLGLVVPSALESPA